MLFNGILGLGLLSAVASILSRVFLCIAVHKDSKEHDENNSIMWTVLAALFGWIPVIIYVFLRYREKKGMIFCPHCRMMISRENSICLFCKQPIDRKQVPFISSEVKRFLILAAIFFIVDSIISLMSRINISFNFV